jgi:hypothetical protein
MDPFARKLYCWSNQVKGELGSWVEREREWRCCFPFPRPNMTPTIHLSPSCLITGPKTAVLATKGCISQVLEGVTFIQHFDSPDLTAVSFSNFCEESLCNNKENVFHFWKTRKFSGTLKEGRSVLTETPWTPKEIISSLFVLLLGLGPSEPSTKEPPSLIDCLFVNCCLCSLKKHCSGQRAISKRLECKQGLCLLSDVSDFFLSRVVALFM